MGDGFIAHPQTQEIQSGFRAGGGQGFGQGYAVMALA